MIGFHLPKFHKEAQFTIEMPGVSEDIALTVFNIKWQQTVKSSYIAILFYEFVTGETYREISKAVREWDYKTGHITVKLYNEEGYIRTIDIDPSIIDCSMQLGKTADTMTVVLNMREK